MKVIIDVFDAADQLTGQPAIFTWIIPCRNGVDATLASALMKFAESGFNMQYTDNYNQDADLRAAFKLMCSAHFVISPTVRARSEL